MHFGTLPLWDFCFQGFLRCLFLWRSTARLLGSSGLGSGGLKRPILSISAKCCERLSWLEELHEQLQQLQRTRPWRRRLGRVWPGAKSKRKVKSPKNKRKMAQRATKEQVTRWPKEPPKNKSQNGPKSHEATTRWPKEPTFSTGTSSSERRGLAQWTSEKNWDGQVASNQSGLKRFTKELIAVALGVRYEFWWKKFGLTCYRFFCSGSRLELFSRSFRELLRLACALHK